MQNKSFVYKKFQIELRTFKDDYYATFQVYLFKNFADKITVN